MNDLLNQHYLFILVFLILGLLTVISNSLTLRRFDQYPQAKNFPRVSILVPARNEGRNIEACVTSLLAQDYPDFEVIVLDDYSTDETPDILARLIRTNESSPGKSQSKLQILKGMPLPDGWLGKHWACQQLAQVANGELILFTDADTRHMPNMLRDSVSALLAEKADLVTAIPREEVITWGERLLVPFIGVGIFVFLPLRLIQKFRWSAVSVTIGQFMLFRRRAYDAVGGYEAVRAHIVDDISLGRLIIDNGFAWRLMDATEHVTCRMYQGFWHAVGGFSKSLFATFDYRILPYLLGWTVVWVVFLDAPLALFSRLLGVPSMPFPPILATTALILSYTLWLTAFHRLKFPLILAFLYPLSLTLFIMVAMRSFVQTLRGTATWKDRQLERAERRWF